MTAFTYTGRGGIFPCQAIEEAIRGGIITADKAVTPEQIQPNSLDLRIGPTAYRIGCSFLPGHDGVEKKLARYKWYEFPIDEKGSILERNQVYLIPLRESLRLPAGIAASANPKSSTGRLDVFTRLVTENGTAFDDVPDGYKGRLYVEVVPRSFPIKVRPDDCLAQIRFAAGDPRLTDEETRDMLNAEDIIVGPQFEPLRARDLRVASGVFLTVDIVGAKPAGTTIGYRARKHQNPIDLRDIGKISIKRYWERIYSKQNLPMILEPDEFYIFASRELVRLPPSICAEMVPFDAGSGELRTHYAGFFDSGFGYSTGERAGVTAAAVVLEIRNRDVPFLIEQHQPLFRLILLHNTQPPNRIYGSGAGSNYQNQRLRLSKQFTRTDDDDDIDESPSTGGALSFDFEDSPP